LKEAGFRGEVAVVVPAAGSGTRMGGHRKQFRELGGRPVLVQTLLVFERHPKVDHIIVATPEDAVRPLAQELRRVGITKLEAVVPGGATRQESVRNAIGALPPLVDVVLVHDAVRPFVRLSLVSEVIRAATAHGAAAPAIPVLDTVRRSVSGSFGETVDREGLVRMQTPQGFALSLLTEAHEKAETDKVGATDDVGLVQRIGARVGHIEGSQDNVKITTPEDWRRATEFWPLWERVLRMEERARTVVTRTS
jgi:2-C-methyl-D-erythritol 4-phosphate cytidylyltransferase